MRLLSKLSRRHQALHSAQRRRWTWHRALKRSAIRSVAAVTAASLVAFVAGTGTMFLTAVPAHAQVTVNSGTVSCSVGNPFVVATGLPNGEQVTVTITQQTQAGHPEGTEGEGVVLALQSATDLTTPWAADPANYGLPQSTVVTADQDGEILYAYFSNCDGDEWADLISSVIIGTPLTQDPTKAAAGHMAFWSGLLGTTVGLVSCGPTFGAGCAFAAAMAGGSIGAGIVGEEPPDPNFAEIYKPVIPNAPQVQAGGGVTQAEANSDNVLLRDSATLLAYSRAFYTSSNRATGAAQAGNSYWEKRQQQAAKSYGLVLAAKFDTLSQHLSQMATVFTNSGFTPVSLTLAQAQAAQQNIFANGLPASEVSALSQLGLNSTEIQGFQTFAANAPTNQLTTFTFPRDFANPTLLNLLHTLASDIRNDMSKINAG